MYKKSIDEVSVFREIDYDSYMQGTVEERKKLIINCIFETIPMIKKRCRASFDAKKFKEDLESFIEEYHIYE